MKSKYPFRETPILYGKDAIRFEEEMRRVENLSLEERRRNREKLERDCEKLGIKL